MGQVFPVKICKTIQGCCQVVNLRCTFGEMTKRFHKIRFNERTLRMEEVPFALRDYLLYGFKRLTGRLLICLCVYNCEHAIVSDCDQPLLIVTEDHFTDNCSFSRQRYLFNQLIFERICVNLVCTPIR